MMEGYTVKEAATVLGVPSERVWELIARGVLAAEPEGKTGMRVFLQPRVPATTQRGGRTDGNGDADRSNDPFRELLTEFRNLTERYGQALLALGEARGEVASLRSRVDLLEARIDLRLSSAEPAPPLAWAAPPQTAPAPADREDAPTTTPEPAPAPEAEPFVEPEPTEAVVEPTAAIDEPTEAIDEPTEAIDEPTAAIDEPTEVMTEPAEMVVEQTELTEPISEPAETLTEPTDAIVEEAPAEAGPPVTPPSAEEHRPVTPSGEAAPEEAGRATRRRRRALSNREAVAWFAEALARADDPSRPELPGSREVAEALAALRGASGTVGESSVEEEILVGASASAEEVPIAEEQEPQIAPPRAEVAAPIELQASPEPALEPAEPDIAPEPEAEATSLAPEPEVREAVTPLEPEVEAIGPAPEPEVEAIGPAPEPEVEAIGSAPETKFEAIGPAPEKEFEAPAAADEAGEDVTLVQAAGATETSATDVASPIAPPVAPPVTDEAPTTYGEPEEWSRPGPSYGAEVERQAEFAHEPEPEPPLEPPRESTAATVSAEDEPDLQAYSTQFDEPDWISDDDLEGADSTAASDSSVIEDADDAARAWTLDQEPVVEAPPEPAADETPTAPIAEALEHDDLEPPAARHADHFLQGTALEPFDLDAAEPAAEPSVEPESSEAAAYPATSSEAADESRPGLAQGSSEMYEAELEFATPGWHVPGQDAPPPPPHEGADEALPGEDLPRREPLAEPPAAAAWELDEPSPDKGEPEKPPDRSLPGADALDDAMAAFGRPPAAPQTHDRETFNASPAAFPDRSMSVPPAFNWRPSPEAQAGTDPNWLGDRQGPAARAYRRLRRIFPG